LSKAWLHLSPFPTLYITTFVQQSLNILSYPYGEEEEEEEEEEEK
jgi:hypothetical protein